LKTNGGKGSVSARNKKRKGHKPLQEKQVDKKENIPSKRAKKPKINIDHTRGKKLSEDELKEARKNILDLFNKSKGNDNE
tara:strand:+ start:417 stop:656 length:240 start_codon:yes stop_codon:yes gene_type:complete